MKVTKYVLQFKNEMFAGAGCFVCKNLASAKFYNTVEDARNAREDRRPKPVIKQVVISMLCKDVE